MKHAIMIMAHNNYDQLKRLISLYDNPDIDFFIHINKRSTDWEEDYLDGTTVNSNIYFAPRVAIKYCDYSQVEAIKSLLSTAMVGHYDYYHIISGADLPLHSPKIFLDFFDKKQGLEFIGFEHNYDTSIVGFRFFFKNTIRTTKSELFRKILCQVHKVTINAQRILGVNLSKNFKGEIKKGFDWWSITHGAAELILKEEPDFKRCFQYTYCPSELIVQTIVYNSTYRDNLYDYIYPCKGSLREIDWKRGRPWVWRKDDYQYLINSPCMFARKFDKNIDSEIIELISNHVKNI